MLFHLPNPNPKLAKHLTAKYPFLKPVGTSFSPTNFELQAEHLSTMLKVRSCFPFDILAWSSVLAWKFESCLLMTVFQ